MADIGYSDEYSIYMTREGLRFLTNKTSIKIMGLLTVSEMTVTEISSVLQESKSSIQSNMMKLSRWGLVSSNTDPNDKRRIIYFLSAMLIMKSSSPGESVEVVTEDVIRRILKMDGQHHKNSIILSSIMPYMMGTTILPLMARVSGMVTAHFMPDVKGMSDEEFLVAMTDLSEKVKLPPMVFDIGDVKSVTVDCRGKSSLEIRIMRGIVSGFVNRFLYARYGGWYYQDAFSVSPEGMMKIEFTGYIGNFENVNYLMTYDSMRDPHQNWSFAILSKGERSMLFGNEAQIKIIVALTQSKKSLKELSDELSIPSVTVHMNIAKLMEEGVVVADNNTRSKYVYYSLEAAPMMLPTGSDAELLDARNQYIGMLGKDPANFFELVAAASIGIFREAGIDVWYLLKRTGSAVASTIIKDNPDLDAQTFLDLACILSKNTSSKLDVKTYIPLCFSIEGRYGNLGMARYISPVFNGIIETGLKLITGEDRKIYFEPKSE